MVEFQRKDFYSYEDFLEIMRLLRAPGGCPWDREQTHSSIRRNFLEETYEVLDAIDHDDASGMCEELGDVYRELAAAWDCLYLDAKTVTREVGGDKIHLTADAHSALGRAIAAIIKENE